MISCEKLGFPVKFIDYNPTTSSDRLDWNNKMTKREMVSVMQVYFLVLTETWCIRFTPE